MISFSLSPTQQTPVCCTMCVVNTMHSAAQVFSIDNESTELPKFVLTLKKFAPFPQTFRVPF